MNPPLPLDAGLFVTFAGLGVITLVTRGFFLLPRREWPLPAWLHEALRYAPLAALAAVVAPELVPAGSQGLDATLLSRLAAALAGAAWYHWRHGILGTIVCGMTVLGLLRIIGW